MKRILPVFMTLLLLFGLTGCNLIQAQGQKNAGSAPGIATPNPTAVPTPAPTAAPTAEPAAEPTPEPAATGQYPDMYTYVKEVTDPDPLVVPGYDVKTYAENECTLVIQLRRQDDLDLSDPFVLFEAMTDPYVVAFDDFDDYAELLLEEVAQPAVILRFETYGKNGEEIFTSEYYCNAGAARMEGEKYRTMQDLLYDNDMEESLEDAYSTDTLDCDVDSYKGLLVLRYVMTDVEVADSAEALAYQKHLSKNLAEYQDQIDSFLMDFHAYVAEPTGIRYEYYDNNGIPLYLYTKR